jgi:hypothetical protein
MWGWGGGPPPPPGFILVAIPLRSRFINTPNVTLVERFQVDVEQFLTMLRFENRSKVEELSLIS